MLNAGELQQLREALPPFGDDAFPPAPLVAFCRAYHLDFSAHFPEAAYRGGYIDSGEHRLMLHRWLQPAARGNLFLVHGYFDHSGLFDKLVAYGLSRGYNVLIFDLPGHGLSSGEPAAIDDFGEYALAIEDALAAGGLPANLPLYAIGQSTGCAALTEYARRGSWPFAGVAYLAPLVRPAHWTLVRLGIFLMAPFTEGVARKFNRNTSDGAFLEFVRSDPLQASQVSLRWLVALKRWLGGLSRKELGVGPLLLVQGRQDSTVDWRYNVPFVLDLFAGSEVCYLPRAGHQLANESADIREVYYAALDQWFQRRSLR
ncbi:alpha/beta hydrolase [Mangrovimicrobium sediminis]|uniref:Alpha/beta hydrolase n=1 Tax=Mangrovimicrobium sediminis TaxID=2562682 RepID=A0A4Z0LZP7_9GAMM|nr:alpha/beta hydrolase [Haliea sp. SAOS-164]TGD72704.1 alpha/beta hydrolase [Haliea sp. SAOS-164]